MLYVELNKMTKKMNMHNTICLRKHTTKRLKLTIYRIMIKGIHWNSTVWRCLLDCEFGTFASNDLIPDPIVCFGQTGTPAEMLILVSVQISP